MHQRGLFRLQKRHKGGGIRHDAVAHTVRLALRFGLAHAEHRELQFREAAQSGKLPGQPAAAYITGFCQTAGGCRLRQHCLYQPENLHHIHLKNSSATFSGVNSG